MSDTPETDEQVNGKPCTRFGIVAGDSLRDALVQSSFARKLERERDEARAENDILRLDAQREAEHHDRMVGELEKVYKERDEARELLASEKITRNHVIKRGIEMQKERDEAREEHRLLKIILDVIKKETL